MEASIPCSLRYVSDAAPGITRRRAEKGFIYYAPDGTIISDPAILQRLQALAIPPAWEQVWISPDPKGHIQALGRDRRGRRQYRYHAEWSAHRNEAKFGSLRQFAARLPALRRRVARDLHRPPLEHARMAAAAVRLLDTTHIRVGNREYARQNDSYGLTTLRTRHVHVEGACLELHYRAKGGKERRVWTCDRTLARIVRRCQELPGQELFRYRGAKGELIALDSEDVNSYIREALNGPFSAKDFRTWGGTVIALKALQRRTKAGEHGQRALGAALGEVAEQLGNTKAISRKYYIHPALIQAFNEGRLEQVIAEADTASAPPGLHKEERLAYALLGESSGERAGCAAGK